MKELGRYIDGQRQVIDAAYTWVCPACVGLNNVQKIDRECQSRKELTRVTWMPSWEPEDIKKTWPTFQQRLLELEAGQSESDLSQPKETLPFLTLRDKALKGLVLLTLGVLLKARILLAARLWSWVLPITLQIPIRVFFL
eukprot:1147402-Pelagomonas_calceolata.AAC.1